MDVKALRAVVAVALVSILAVLFAACGGGDDDVTLADFEGVWTGVSYTLTANDDPSLSVELISMGATVTFDTGDSGNASGTFGVPEAFGGPLELPVDATFELEDQETMTVTFEEEIPPLLTSYTGPFELEGDTMTLTDENASFELTEGAGPVPVTAVAVFERN